MLLRNRKDRGRELNGITGLPMTVVPPSQGKEVQLEGVDLSPGTVGKIDSPPGAGPRRRATRGTPRMRGQCAMSLINGIDVPQSAHKISAMCETAVFRRVGR